ncbi:MAG TPA: Gfo/Idh/MocA family oxidoreductase [Candidatus Acidoferrales bacterium]|nr:Gfo/Idh/MocA family oxidoreductase [Candidatus Acidoferrales bacterium]
MNDTVRVGVIGSGRVGQIGHLGPLSQMREVRLAALAELRPELGKRVLERYGVERLYRTHRELLDDREVDAVVVVTRREHTAGVVLDALRARKHVLSEKPMAQTLEEAHQLVEAAASAGTVYAIGYMKRSDDVVHDLHGRLASAAWTESYGILRETRVRMCCGDDTGKNEADWIMTEEARPGEADRRDSELGTFLNVYSHATNVTRYLVNEPYVPVDVERAAEMRVRARAASGSRIDFVLADRRDSAWDESVTLVFERATVRVDFPAPFQQDGRVRAVIENEDRTEKLVSSVWAHARQAQRFVDAIRGGEAMPCSGADALLDVAFATELMQVPAQ